MDLQDGDLESRQQRWGSLISELEDELDIDDDEDEIRETPAFLAGKFACVSHATADELRHSSSATVVSKSSMGSTVSSVRAADASLISSFCGIENKGQPQPHIVAAQPTSPQTVSSSQSLRDWVESNKTRTSSLDISRKRKYFEQSVRILHSLTMNLTIKHVVGHDDDSLDGNNEYELCIRPDLINAEHVIISDGGKTAAFVLPYQDILHSNAGHGGKFDDAATKYAAMHALGKISYELFMRGKGPSISEFCSSADSVAKSSSSSNAMSIHDSNPASDGIIDENEILNLLRKNSKNPRKTLDKESGGVVSAMSEAGVPFPLCRFVSDLLDGHGSDCGLFRSDVAFTCFSDIISDLKQMIEQPEAFLHSSAIDRWNLAFGEKMYGREKETKALLDVAERVTTSFDNVISDTVLPSHSKRQEVIMVSGHSGSGKSRLVRELRAPLEKQGWHFLCCKFDRVIHSEPLSIISVAFDEYFEHWSNCPMHSIDEGNAITSSVTCSCPGESVQCIRQRLKKMIDPDGLRILSKHMPHLRHLLKLTSILDASLPESREVTKKHMHNLFGALLQALSPMDYPIAFFLDDLQWADNASLELLSALCKRVRCDFKQDYNVMFIGSYRDNEVGADHLVTKVLGQFQVDTSINITEIPLSGFALESLNEMISKSLCLPPRRTMSLAEIVFQKTDGHPLFVIEFLESLISDKLLTHSFVGGWEWDVGLIDLKCITDSVAELFTFKLRRLPRTVLQGLHILSCFGSQVDQHILRFISDYDGEASIDTMAVIDASLGKGLIEQAGSIYMFTHDMIQQATFDLMDHDTQVQLLRKLTATLIKNASAANEIDSVLFVAVDMINRIGSDAVLESNERALYANLNLTAGVNALSAADFSSAVKYAESGISLLDEMHWALQYDLSLGLYETAVLAHYPEGNHEQLEKRMNQVFKSATCFNDKFKTHCVWIKVLSLENLPRAIDESLIVLEQLGEPLDPNSICYQMVRDELAKKKDYFTEDRKRFFLSLSQMTDCDKCRAMAIMSSLVTYYHSLGSVVKGAFIACRMVELSINYGHCDYTSYGTGSIAAYLVNIMDDIDAGSVWGRMALSLMKLHYTDPIIPSTYCAVYGVVLCWKEPLQSTLGQLFKACRIAFSSGNIEFASYNTIFYASRSFNAGKNIDVLLGEVEALARQHEQYNQISLIRFYLSPLYNTLRELKGVPEQPLVPLTEWMHNEDILNVVLKKQQLGAAHRVLSYLTTEAFMFRDMEKARRMADAYIEYFGIEDQQSPKYNKFYNVFYEALIAFYFIRKTEEQTWKVRARDAHAKVKEWSRHSTWNFENKLHLLNAEMHHTHKEHDKAVECYAAAILSAHKHRFLHEEALSCELAGYFFADHDEKRNSQEMFQQAYNCYMKWGAVKKAGTIPLSHNTATSF